MNWRTIAEFSLPGSVAEQNSWTPFARTACFQTMGHGTSGKLISKISLLSLLANNVSPLASI